MTYEQIIEQRHSLSTSQKRQLGYYFLLSSIQEEKTEYDLIELIENDFLNFSPSKKQKTLSISEILKKHRGKVKNVWEDEDAQLYVNKLREDDREF